MATRLQLPIRPSRDNAAGDVEPVETDRSLPTHLTPVAHPDHTAVCDACGFWITVGPSGLEYGHARRRNRAPGPDRRACPHRPEEVEPRQDCAADDPFNPHMEADS